MSPEAALECQLEAYRRMTGEERLAIALGLHELSCEIARAGIRDQHPNAGPEEVERLLHQRIALARELEK
jgi:Rv0078B-related antitoxin